MSSERLKGLAATLVRIVAEDVEPMLSRNSLARAASVLPEAAFANLRTALFRAAGTRIGPRSRIQGHMRVTGYDNPCALVTIGRNTLVTGGLHLDVGAPVRIGNNVRIGHDVSLLTINHAVGSERFRAGTSFAAEVVIHDNCWIASRVTILPGVEIGRASIVAAGSVVTRSVPPNCLVAGVPARVVRELPPQGDQSPPPNAYQTH